jgi:F-type H+-transporting ATPase subunit b
MQINLFTVVAQVLNFLVLVWLMKRYLYKPILSAIEEREKKIQGQLDDAKNDKAEAKAEQDEFSKKNQVFDQQKKDLMDRATAEAEAQGQKLLNEAKNNAKTLQDKLETASKAQQEDLNHRLEQKTEQEVFAITKKVLADLADVSVEAQSVVAFIRRINDLKANEKAQFIQALQTGSGPILVKSGFELAEKQQDEIERAVGKMLGTKLSLEFKTAPALIGGIELSTKGYKLAWSIAAYLSSFEKNVAEANKPIAIAKRKHGAIK